AALARRGYRPARSLRLPLSIEHQRGLHRRLSPRQIPHQRGLRPLPAANQLRPTAGPPLSRQFTPRAPAHVRQSSPNLRALRDDRGSGARASLRGGVDEVTREARYFVFRSLEPFHLIHSRKKHKKAQRILVSLHAYLLEGAVDKPEFHKR